MFAKLRWLSIDEPPPATADDVMLWATRAGHDPSA
jgi:hypothetical protein